MSFHWHNVVVPDAVDVLSQECAAEEKRIIESWGYPDKRTALLEICRAIDLLYLSNDHDGELRDECRQGANKAILLFVDDSFNEKRTSIFPSDDRTFMWALSALRHSGRLAMCEKILDYHKAGLCDLSVSENSLAVRFIPKFQGVEALEAAEFDKVIEMVADAQQPFWRLLDSDTGKILESMRPLVYCWADHYIGYDTDPQIDEYFDAHALLRAQLMTGQDAFRDDSVFGGLPFNFYTRVVWTMIGWAVKHVEFAKILGEKEPHLLMQNLLTVTGDVDQVAANVAAALGCTSKDSAQAVALLEMNLQNARESCINGHAPPPLIRSSREQFIRPLTGFLQTPFEFMLRRLKHDYRSDWDRAVGQREGLFREELFKLFPQDWVIKMPVQVTLRRPGAVVTDIDAVMLDLRNGTAGLFQLKWQDTFGHSMRERRARMNNFQRETTAWVDRVHSYFSTTPTDVIRELFGIKAREWKPLRYLLFVLGRNFAQFSGDALPDPRAAWGLWPQAVKLCKENRKSHNPIETFHSKLIQDSPMHKVVHTRGSTFPLGPLAIKMEPTGDSGASRD